MLPMLARAFVTDAPPQWMLLLPTLDRSCTDDARRKQNASEQTRSRKDPTGMNIVPPRPGHTRPSECTFPYLSLLLAAEREHARMRTSDCLSVHPDVYDPGRHIDGTRCESRNCPGGARQTRDVRPPP